jgi:hypothetical protein
MTTTATKERPILFSATMVRALLEGIKTQTRRVAKLTAGGHVKLGSRRWHPNDQAASLACPYGQPGELLWVRESWCPANVEGKAHYRATSDFEKMLKWRPSIHMPRWACRLVLEVVSVRVERLHEISEADAKAEGVKMHVDTEGCPPGKGRPMFPVLSPYGSKDRMTVDHIYRWEYASLWDDINKARGLGWATNPRVWVVEFKRLEVARG